MFDNQDQRSNPSGDLWRRYSWKLSEGDAIAMVIIHERSIMTPVCVMDAILDKSGPIMVVNLFYTSGSAPVLQRRCKRR